MNSPVQFAYDRKKSSSLRIYVSKFRSSELFHPDRVIVFHYRRPPSSRAGSFSRASERSAAARTRRRCIAPLPLALLCIRRSNSSVRSGRPRKINYTLLAWISTRGMLVLPQMKYVRSGPTDRPWPTQCSRGERWTRPEWVSDSKESCTCNLPVLRAYSLFIQPFKQ